MSVNEANCRRRLDGHSRQRGSVAAETIIIVLIMSWEEAASSLHPQHLDRLVEANGHTLLLSLVPLQLIDLSIRRVGQHRLLQCLGSRGDVPDERVMVVTAGAQVIRRVWRPRQTIHAGLVRIQFNRGNAWHSHVYDDDLWRVGEDGGNVVVVDAVPGHAQQGGLVRGLVQNRRVLQSAEVKVQLWSRLLTSQV